MFIGLHGAWNRRPPAGYKIVFVPFSGGQPHGLLVADEVAFVETIPLGATGKMQKNKLREQFKGYKLATA